MDTMIRLAVFLAGFTAVSSIMPSIVGDFLVEVKPMRSTGRLNCTTINLDISSVVVWEHRNSEMVISENEMIVPLNTVYDGKQKFEIIRFDNGIKSTFMLVINRLTEEDGGNYTCYIRIHSAPYTNWPRKIQNLLVLVPPSMDSTVTQGAIEVNEGERVTMVCGASGVPAPNITWSKESGGMLPWGGPIYRGTHLVIENMMKNWGGIYVCTADNNVVPPASTKVQLLVFSAPFTRAVQETVGQAQNRQYHATLECVISGYPRPEMKWSRDTNEGLEDLNDNEKFVISKMLESDLKSGDVWYSLKILNVQANDYTTYYCAAQNSYGKHNSTVSLFDSLECQGANCPSFGASNMAAPRSVHVSVLVLTLVLSFTLTMMV